MSMAPGTITVDGHGVATGGGFAFSLYSARVGAYQPGWTAAGIGGSEAAVVAMKKLWAAELVAFATVIISEITSAAQVPVAANAFGAGIPAAPQNLSVT